MLPNWLHEVPEMRVDFEKLGREAIKLQSRLEARDAAAKEAEEQAAKARQAQRRARAADEERKAAQVPPHIRLSSPRSRLPAHMPLYPQGYKGVKLGAPAPSTPAPSTPAPFPPAPTKPAPPAPEERARKKSRK